MPGKRLFFGWWVLFGIFTSYTALVGIQVFSLPLLYPVLEREFGWSHDQVTFGATIFFLTGAFLTPLVSPLFDRFSVRNFMIAGAIFTVLAFFGYSRLQTVGWMVFIYMVFSLSQVCAGQVPTMLIAARWFRRRRGIAFGITLMGPDIGGAIFPLIMRPFLVAGEWRQMLILLMVISGVMMLLPMIFFIRSRPEDKELLPDGDPMETETSDNREQKTTHTGLTLKEALRTPAFYILAFTTGSLWFCMNGITQHQSLFMDGELGLSMDTLPVIVSAIFWFAIIGKLSIGYLSDHFNKILMMFTVIVILAGGLVLLRISSADNLFGLYCYAAAFGIGYSGTFTMIQLVIAEFYSGQSYGKILGVLTMVDVGAGGIAITVLAKMQGAYNSYLPVIEFLTGLTCFVAVLILLLYRMRRNTRRDTLPAS